MSIKKLIPRESISNTDIASPPFGDEPKPRFTLH